MNTIITIGRQYGSGGREIGEKLAKRLNIPFYDKELLSRAAKESGFAALFSFVPLIDGYGHIFFWL